MVKNVMEGYILFLSRHWKNPIDKVPDSAELSHCPGNRKKRRKHSTSPCDDVVCHTADAAVTAGEVLFRLKVKAHVEFGDCGSDSDGRILRIVEYFTESYGSNNLTAPVC